MSVNYNPVTPTSGLVLYLDAGNRRSYPGSGATWFDLSPRNNHSDLTNMPTFTNSNFGAFNFNGIGNYITLPNSGIRNLLSTNCTIVLVISCGSFTGLTFPTIIGSMSYSAPWAGWRVNVNASIRTLSFNHASNFDGANQSSIGFNYVLPDNINQYVYLACTWNATTRSKSTYVNGLLTNYVSSSTYGFGQNLLEDTRIGSLSNSQLDNFFRGNVGVVKLYNRELSSAEILQSFSSIRGRYNI